MTDFNVDNQVLNEANANFPVGSRIIRTPTAGHRGVIVAATAFGRTNAAQYVGGAFYTSTGEGPFMAIEWDHRRGTTGAAWTHNLTLDEPVSQYDDHGYPRT